MSGPDLNTYPAPDDNGWTMARWWTESTPLDNYQHAIELFETNPSRQTYEALLRAHYDCISYALLKAPWHARAYREWRFNKLQRRHVSGVGRRYSER